MRVAIVHYWLITRRGGEKVVESILKIFPEADIYTLFLDGNIYGPDLPKQRIYTSCLNNPKIRKHYQKLFPLYPIGIKSLKLKDEYDLIISSESGPAKGISTPKGIPHICYIHSPMRYCWGFTDEYLRDMSKFLRPIARFFFERLRIWDLKTVENVTHYIANSNNVAKRVKKYYNRESVVIYPPIESNLFKRPLMDNTERDIFLSFGAITPYKRIDLLVETFNQNKLNLVVIGNGSELGKLRQRANSNIQFLGSLEWEEIERYLDRTRALLFPGEEDFGMIPLEVMSYGIPVLAYGQGGALETVIDNGQTSKSSGMFFDEQSVESIQKCLERFLVVENKYDKNWIRSHARKFGEDVFLEKFKKEVDLICNR
jgi:glycosyltransferase involved in cell wall biosynthesis